MLIFYRHMGFPTVWIVCLSVMGLVAARPQQEAALASPSSPQQGHKAASAQTTPPLTAAQRKKITIDLDRIDAQGLRGPEDGKVSISYMFAIPDTKRCREQVHRIDPTAKFLPEGYRRAGGHKGDCLCTGDTSQPHWRTVLYRLAALPYVKSIDENFFE